MPRHVKNHTVLILERLISVKAEIDATRDAYREYDELIEELLSTGETGPWIIGSKKIQIVDNFSDKNTSWKASAVRRFEIEILPAIERVA